MILYVVLSSWGKDPNTFHSAALSAYLAVEPGVSHA